jgi:hypothetical protein
MQSPAGNAMLCTNLAYLALLIQPETLYNTIFWLN